MKLLTLIEGLEKISKESDNPDDIEVKLADNAPIVKSIFKNGTVYITDIEIDICSKIKI